MVAYPLEQFATPPFGLDKDAIVQYAFDRGSRRLGTIASARGRDLREVEGDREPLELEERFGREDAQAYDEA
jgi:ribonucleoside-diphosphate reductase beta chain